MMMRIEKTAPPPNPNVGSATLSSAIVSLSKDLGLYFSWQSEVESSISSPCSQAWPSHHGRHHCLIMARVGLEGGVAGRDEPHRHLDPRGRSSSAHPKPEAPCKWLLYCRWGPVPPP